MSTKPQARGKLLFLNRFYDPDTSATSQLLTDLARELATRSGSAVHVLCSCQLYTDPAARLPARETLHGVVVHRVRTTRYGRAGLPGRALDYVSFYVSATLTLLAMLRRGDVVIAKTDPPLISIPAALCARLKGATLVNWQQDVFPEVASRLSAHALPGWIDALLKRLRDWSLRAATVNVTIGRRMLEYFAGRGIPGARLQVIENWADGAAIAPKPPAASALRRRLGLLDEFVVCYSGNLGRAHEFDTLVDAAECLREQTDIRFLLIGGGAKMESLRQSVGERALKQFCFLPYQPRAELEDSLAAADVHLISLLPDLEGLIVPSKLYAVMAAARPAIFIGDADGEIARVLREAQCGLTVAVNAARTLADAILGLRADRQACALMGQRARQFFASRYTREHAIEKWTTLLHRCRSEPASPAQRIRF